MQGLKAINACFLSHINMGSTKLQEVKAIKLVFRMSNYKFPKYRKNVAI